MAKSDVRSEINSIVADVRRLRLWQEATGQKVIWDVEQADGRQDWLYRITCGDGTRVQLHQTPSDRNWRAVIQNQLDDGGFSDDMALWKEWERQERQRKLREDRERNAAKTLATERRAKKAAEAAAALALAAGPLAPQPFKLEWLKARHEYPQSVLGIMTPEVAAALIDKETGINTRNRPMRQWKVEEFKRLIQGGDFAPTHQGGAIDWNGVLQDGQKRLKAIAETGIPVEMWWSVGMDPKYFDKVDQGSTRSAADAAFMQEIANPKMVASAAKMVLNFEMLPGEAHWRRAHTSIPVITRFYNTKRGNLLVRERLEDSVFLAKETRKDLRDINPTALAAAVFLIGDKLPESDPRVTEFFNDLRYGESRKPHPVWLLRQVIINQPDGRGKLSNWDTLAYILLAWRHACQKTTTLRQLRWSPAQMAFPAVFLPPPEPAEFIAPEHDAA